MRMRFQLTVIIVITIIHTGILPANAAAWNVGALTSDLPLLQPVVPQTHTTAAREYFDYYGLDFADTVHQFGVLSAGGFTIATHLFSPPKPRGTVYLVHGYLDHTGLLTGFIEDLLIRGYAVVAFDLPGHGLSSGQQAGIDDFGQYGGVFSDLYSATREKMPGPHHLVAHSTGCSMVLDLIQAGGSLPFERVIMLAPLVRSKGWGWSRFGTAVAGGLVKTVPRQFRKNSSEAAYVKFVEDEDPLQSLEVPMSWVKALQAWNDKAENYDIRPTDLLIIQGTRDVIVQWKYNMDFLSEKLPNARIELIEGANHQLMNESKEYRLPVFKMIGDYLRENRN
jgi:lysophospholipase